MPVKKSTVETKSESGIVIDLNPHETPNRNSLKKRLIELLADPEVQARLYLAAKAEENRRSAILNAYK